MKDRRQDQTMDGASVVRSVVSIVLGFKGMRRNEKAWRENMVGRGKSKQEHAIY